MISGQAFSATRRLKQTVMPDSVDLEFLRGDGASLHLGEADMIDECVDLEC